VNEQNKNKIEENKKNKPSYIEIEESEQNEFIGFEIDKNGFILDFKKNVTINPNNESSHSGDEILYSGI
jgi:hypothetical protein